MAIITGNNFSNTLFGTSENDQIDGLAGNDGLLGFDGDDSLDGGIGNDVLTGHQGADTLTGGSGSDRFVWDVSSGLHSTSQTLDTVTDFEGAGITGGDTIQLSPSSRTFVFRGLQAAVPALGSPLGYGNNGFTEIFYAFDGTNTILFADSNDNGIFDADDFAVRFSGQHNFTTEDFSSTQFVIPGTDKSDTIIGEAGNDRIFGLDGNDLLIGGAGDDQIVGGDGNDTIEGGDGNDFFGSGLSGGNGNDTISGGAGNDFLRGDAGNDRLDGGAGRDRLSGGDGNDVMFGGADADVLDGDGGNDKLYGGDGSDDLWGHDGNDELYGEEGNDELFGMDGNDIMNGGAGDDLLMGEAGADQLTGGSGDDEFEFFLGFKTDSTFAQYDTVHDFEGAGTEGGDELELRNTELVFRGEVSVDPILGANLVGGGNGVADLLYTVREGNTWMLVDLDDNGTLDATDFAIRFIGEMAFTEADFGGSTNFIRVGTDGDDVIAGTDGDDKIFGLAGNDRISGLDGNDQLYGGAGDDYMDGGPGGYDDLLYGDDGNDTLSLRNSFGGSADGGAGDDIIIGSNDPYAFTTLYGGTGNDVFVFGEQWGAPYIRDFEDGSDRIDLRESGLVFEDLTIEDWDGTTAILSNTGNNIFLVGVQVENINANDFIFA